MLVADRQFSMVPGDQPALPPPPVTRRLGLLLGGVLLPLVPLLLPLFFREGLLIDPAAQPWLFLATFLVPVMNLYAWCCPRTRLAPAALAFAATVAGYYSLVLSPLSVIILFASIFLIGLPLAAPFLALWVSLRELLEQVRTPRFGRGVAAGACVAVSLVAAAEVPAYLAQLVIDGNTAPVSWPGVADALDRRCHRRDRTPLEHWIAGYGPSEQACSLTYLASGRVRPPGAAHLSRSESEMRAVLDAATGTQQIDWQMEFANAQHFAQEARLRIALPPQSAVHQVSLWVNGEERQAAFGAAAKVTAAYENVAYAQRRDPLLVTAAGADQILVRAFPVPAQGRMRIRLGIASPLGDHFLSPVILEENLSGRQHRIELSQQGVRLAERVTPLPFAFRWHGAAERRPALDPLDPSHMITAGPVPGRRAFDAVVVDGCIGWPATRARLTTRSMLCPGGRAFGWRAPACGRSTARWRGKLSPAAAWTMYRR